MIATTRSDARPVEFRAGGTDLTERRRSGVSHGPVADIEPGPGMQDVTWRSDGGATVGALVTIDRVATDPRLRAGYPALVAAAAGLATPQIRRVATLGGNLLQHTRCWYYRHPDASCLKKGGTSCPARDGNHRLHVAFDLGPCAAPHPSTLGAALLAYEAAVETNLRSGLAVAELWGDGSVGTRDHLLAPGELLTAIRLPAPSAGERGAYLRAISRTYAEWPLVECVVRLVLAADGGVTRAGVAVGGVAPVPMRLAAVEAALLGRPAGRESLQRAADLAAEGANPLPMTRFKVPLLVATVAKTLERAAGAAEEEVRGVTTPDSH